MVEIDLSTLFSGKAKLALFEKYQKQAVHLAGNGNEIVLTGAAPVWLYLGVAHALHGKAKRLLYLSPVTGKVEIFNHDPF